MSTATEPAATPAATAGATCANCDAPLQPGQDWCVECGTAVSGRTGGPARWGPAAALLAVVLVLAGAGVAFAWAALSSGSDTARPLPSQKTPTAAEAQAPAPTTPASTTPAPASTTPAATPTTPGAASPGDVTPGTQTAPSAGSIPAAPKATVVGGWPAGKRAYSVILLSATSHGAARRVADRLAGQGVSVGILDSSKFPSLEPGYSVVFSGQYTDVGAAQQAAQRLSAQAPGAYAKLVSPR